MSPSSIVLRLFRRFSTTISPVGLRAAALLASFGLPTVSWATSPMTLIGNSAVVHYTNTPWSLQKTGTFVPGATVGTGTINWTVAVTKGSTVETLQVVGYFDCTNGTAAPVPVSSVVVNLQKNIGDWTTISSDVADSINGDAATQASVDPDITYEGYDTFQENAASGSLTLTDVTNAGVSLNSPIQYIPAGQTRRFFFRAAFNPAVLALPANTPVQVEVIVSFGNNFEIPSLEILSQSSIPAPTVANDTASLLDNNVTGSGTATAGTFTGLNQTVTSSGSFPVSVDVDGGINGGSICNTANLTSAGATIPFVLDNVTLPPVTIPGVNLTAQDCQPVPKRPGKPHPISGTIESCSQVVTYDASLFTSPNGTIVSATFSPASGSTFPFGASPVTYTVVDSAGVTSTGTFTVNVIDNDAPVITPISNMTVSNEAGKCTGKATYSTTATDCNPVTITYSPVSGSDFPVGVSTVTVTATDTAGHSSSSTFTVTVNDVEAPVLHTSNVTVTAPTGTCGADVTFAATSNDCGLVTYVYSLSATFSPAIVSGANFPIGTTTVYVRATDASGNNSTGSFTVTVVDADAPVITASNIDVNVAPGTCAANVPFTASATDCGAVTLAYSMAADFSTSIASGASFPIGTTKVYVKATDNVGNASTSSFNVTVHDNEAPVITAPNVVVNNKPGTCGADVDFAATAKDCGHVTFVYSMSSTFAPAIVSGGNFPIGTTTIYVRATDDAGNSSTSSFTITVKDTEAPVIAVSNVTVNATAGTCAASVPFAAQATDCGVVTLLYSLSSSFSPTISSGASLPVGVTTVFVKATDATGNFSTSQFTVTVKDVQAPTITSPLTDLTVQPDAGQCYATFNYTPTAVDNCSGAVSVTVSPASGTQLAAGTTTTIVVTATDSAGNVTTKTFNVTVGACPGKLGNFVWNDANANGIQDVGEAGIDGVKVTLFTSTGTQVATTTTAGGGYYLFSNLAAGAYYVIFDKTTLPAGFVFTSQNTGSNDAVDSDANPTTGKSEGNATVVAGGYNDTVDAGAYLPKPPGMTLVKTASASQVQPFQPVTYTYVVTNTGGTTLTNIVVTDDNGTPNFTADDFVVGTIASLAPGASATFTKTLIPVVTMTTVINGNTVPAGTIIIATQPNGDIKATYVQNFNVNDNTYGTGVIGWPGSNHKFDHLVTSDQIEFRFTDKNSKVVLDFRLDYLSAAASTTVPGTGQVINYPSGYGSLGVSGGDGVMVSGSSSNITGYSTSLGDSLNAAANLPYKPSLTVNSPTSLVGGNVVIDSTKAPGGWNYLNSYSVTIKASTFGTAGFGALAIPSQHNSPSKYGCENISTTPGNSVVTNTATATSGTLTATDTATVTIGQCPPPASTGQIGSLVWCDSDGDGIQDAGERGIGGIEVVLKNASGVTIATDITDGDGVYGFTGLAAGTYTVVVATPTGFTASPKAVGTDRAIDSNGSPASVTLATNSSVDLTIDFGFKPSTTCAKPLLTYTQGGWGAQPKGNNPGALLTKYFTTVYPGGYVAIGTSSRYLAFTSAAAVITFLPQGGTAGVLSGSAVNPSTSSAGVLAGQLLAVRLNVDFSAAGKTATGLGAKKVASGPLAGKSVTDVLTIANSVIAGGALPSGLTIASLNDTLTAINENYDNGTTNNGYLY